ncbi:class I SAM-dependent methyltransferase [Bacillus sp. HMF5848]|uniref:class I SAM-dependent methyltransferase n=1 Tax=Bacillus sp. HMF5848 TaxID=2495421 RepID=UPI000F79CCEB|nr:class I SAM-dependent methyltransferase [Bacillus sp. HMF5848]RSK25538.1 class I SAM-dependent methyltransferase [Bacillus sp. HMF5848]
MTEHYYTNSPSVESNRQSWVFSLKGHTLKFTVDNGVFSKKEVDFGSRVLIEAFKVAEIEGPILDVGCGYGPIGLVIAKDNPNRIVHMVDVNERAVELATINAESNQISNVKVYMSDALSAVENNFASILTNPPIRAGKQVVHKIFEQSFDALLPDGELWVVIQKKQGAPSAIDKLKQLFSRVDIVEKQKGYYIIRAKKS